jgi:hypothetical protein
MSLCFDYFKLITFFSVLSSNKFCTNYIIFAYLILQFKLKESEINKSDNHHHHHPHEVHHHLADNIQIDLSNNRKPSVEIINISCPKSISPLSSLNSSLSNSSPSNSLKSSRSTSAHNLSQTLKTISSSNQTENQKNPNETRNEFLLKSSTTEENLSESVSTSNLYTKVSVCLFILFEPFYRKNTYPRMKSQFRFKFKFRKQLLALSFKRERN